MTLGPWRGGLGGVKTPLKHGLRRLTPLGAADCRRRASPPHLRLLAISDRLIYERTVDRRKLIQCVTLTEIGDTGA